MKKTNLLFFIVIALACLQNKFQPTGKSDTTANTSSAGIRIVKSGLNYPWEIIWHDNQIWMTERDGKISRIDPSTGKTNFSFTINEVEARNEGGLLGMALHPDFDHNGLLYVVYNYNSHGKHLEKLVRFT